MLVYAPGWSLASQFCSYTPLPKVDVYAAKKMKIPPLALKTIFLTQFVFLKILAFSVFAAKICHAVLDSRDDHGLPPD